MNVNKVQRLLGLAFVVLILQCSLGCTKKKSLTIGFHPVEYSGTSKQELNAIAKDLELSLNLNVIPWMASDVRSLVDAVRTGKVDVALLPPYAYVVAEKEANALGRIVAVRKGKTQFLGAIIARKPYRSLQDLKGRRVVWSDPLSASGYIGAQIYFAKKGIDPSKFFGKQSFVGGHDALVRAVANGRADAGATFVIDQSKKTGAWTLFLPPKEAAKISIIELTGENPGDVIVANRDFSNHALFKKLEAFFLTLPNHKNAQEAMFKLYGIESFSTLESGIFQEFRKIHETLKLKL